MRELNETDKLFVSFLQTNDDALLAELETRLSPWLYTIISHFVEDELHCVEILKSVWVEFLSNKRNYDPCRAGIEYQFYLIAIEMIKDEFEKAIRFERGGSKNRGRSIFSLRKA